MKTIYRKKEKHYVYFIYNKLYKIIYIGHTKQIQQRSHFHFKNKKEVYKIGYKTFPSKTLALKAECKSIRKYQPKYNINSKKDRKTSHSALIVKGYLKEIYNKFPNYLKLLIQTETEKQCLWRNIELCNTNINCTIIKCGSPLCNFKCRTI